MLNQKRSRSKSNCKDEIIQSSPTKKAKLEEQIDNTNKSDNDNEDIIKKVYTYDSSAKVNCKICSNDISKNIKFLCATCKDFIFCINCLVNEEPHDPKQKSTKSQSQSHDYHIVDKLNFHIFTKDWNASEELLLLTGKNFIKNFQPSKNSGWIIGQIFQNLLELNQNYNAKGIIIIFTTNPKMKNFQMKMI